MVDDLTPPHWGSQHVRPNEPENGDLVWYRGWECGYNDMAQRYASEGWEAYRGGCDLDAPRLSESTWTALLDAIDEEENDLGCIH